MFGGNDQKLPPTRNHIAEGHEHSTHTSDDLNAHDSFHPFHGHKKWEGPIDNNENDDVNDEENKEINDESDESDEFHQPRTHNKLDESVAHDPLHPHPHSPHINLGSPLTTLGQRIHGGTPTYTSSKTFFLNSGTVQNEVRDCHPGEHINEDLSGGNPVNRTDTYRDPEADPHTHDTQHSLSGDSEELYLSMSPVLPSYGGSPPGDEGTQVHKGNMGNTTALHLSQVGDLISRSLDSSWATPLQSPIHSSTPIPGHGKLVNQVRADLEDLHITPSLDPHSQTPAHTPTAQWDLRLEGLTQTDPIQSELHDHGGNHTDPILLDQHFVNLSIKGDQGGGVPLTTPPPQAHTHSMAHEGDTTVDHISSQDFPEMFRVFYSPKFTTHRVHTNSHPPMEASPSPYNPNNSELDTQSTRIRDDRHTSATSLGTQTEFPGMDKFTQTEIPTLVPHISREIIFPQTEEDRRSNIPVRFQKLTVTSHMHSNVRCVFPPQDEEDESIMTSNSVDALIDQIKTLMTDSSKFSVRADYLSNMLDKDLFTPWTLTTQPYPPYIISNPKLLTKIREVRLSAARDIQLIAHSEFERQSLKLQAEGETLIKTVESMTTGKAAVSLEHKLNQTASSVGQTKATLQAQLENREVFLAERQPNARDWDTFFHYSGACRRTRNAYNRDFEVSPEDRANADRETARQIHQALRADSEDESTSNSKKRKRNPSPQNYRIPRNSDRDSNRRHDNNRRPRAQKHHDPDFAHSRPSNTYRNTYYNNDRHRDTNDNRGGRDSNKTRPQQRPRDDLSREAQRRKLKDLQDQLDQLRHY